jgi:hypothetical protein
MIWKAVSKWWISSGPYRVSKSCVYGGFVYQAWFNSESLGTFHRAEEAKAEAEDHKKAAESEIER